MTEKKDRGTGDVPKPASTFQGRPIISMKWNGKFVDAVQGLFAYRMKSGAMLEHRMVENALSVSVSGTSTDRLGIGILSVEGSSNVETAASVATRLKFHEDIMWLEPIMLECACATPNDPFFNVQWGLKAIRAEDAWDLWHGNAESVILAVLDSGIPREAGTLSHPDLSAQRFHLGQDFVNKDASPDDDHGHGTHVLGIAAATTNNGVGISGLWPGTVLVIKVFDNNRNGSTETLKEGIYAALDFAALHNARLVINYSGGGADNNQKRAVVQEALDKGALLVAAAGNDNGGSIIYPAAYSAQFSNVIAVGAVDSHIKRPGFANLGDEMTLVAPGVGIFSTLPNYEVTQNRLGSNTKYDLMDGTSMATPFVSGLAALVWSKWRNLSASQVREKLVESADPIPGSTKEYGSGIINAVKALT